MFFSVATKNSLLKDEMGLRMRNPKNPIFSSGFPKNQYIEGNRLKKGGLDSFRIWGEGGELGKKEGGSVFEREKGGDT